jgi:hypothetical protein
MARKRTLKPRKQALVRPVPKYTPSPWQDALHRNQAKRKWVWAGRRAGKGRAAIQEAISTILEASKTKFIVNGNDVTDTLVPDIHIWTVAPTKAQMRQVWNEMKAYIPRYMWKDYSRAGGRGSCWHEDEYYVELEVRQPNGVFSSDTVRKSVLWELRSADNPETLQTVGLDFLHIAESQDVKQIAWDKVEWVTESPGRMGRIFAEGIPPISRSHWFSRQFKYAENNPSLQNLAVTATSFDNMYLTDQQKENIYKQKETTTEWIWERMVLAKQPDVGGGFFKKIEDAAVGASLSRPTDGHKYVAGLDLGKQVDPTVLIIKNRITRESVYSYEMLKTDWVLQKETLVSEIKKWGCESVMMDSSGMGGDVLFDELLNLGVPVIGKKFTPQTKYQLFLNYAVALQNGTTTFPPEWTKLQNELDSIEVKQNGLTYSFTHPNTQHDDWVDAEVLALMACDPPEAMEEGYEPVFTIKTVAPLTQNGVSYTEGRIARMKRQRKAKQLKELREVVEISTEQESILMDALD